MGEDPIGLNAGYFNLYKYVANNPINLTDPYGENPRVLAYLAFLYKTIKNIKCTYRKSKADHWWGYYYVEVEKIDKCGKKYTKRVKRKCFRRHFEINCRIKGLKNSSFRKQIPIPFSPCTSKK